MRVVEGRSETDEVTALEEGATFPRQTAEPREQWIDARIGLAALGERHHGAVRPARDPAQRDGDERRTPDCLHTGRLAAREEDHSFARARSGIDAGGRSVQHPLDAHRQRRCLLDRARGFQRARQGDTQRSRAAQATAERDLALEPRVEVSLKPSLARHRLHRFQQRKRRLHAAGQLDARLRRRRQINGHVAGYRSRQRRMPVDDAVLAEQQHLARGAPARHPPRPSIQVLSGSRITGVEARSAAASPAPLSRNAARSASSIPESSARAPSIPDW